METQINQKGFWSVGRLVLGIISMVLFVLIMFQSCTAGLVNILTENNALSGTAGFLVASLILAAGIVGVVNRNSPKRGGPIASFILYLIAAIIAFPQGATYGDLPI